MPDHSDLRAKHIREYVEGQADEEVASVELVKVEGVFGEQYEVWDARTLTPKRHPWSRRKKNRWWVVTNMTNLYPFDKYPSLDYLLSFHIGLMHRVIENQRKRTDEDHPRLYVEVWRRFEQAVDMFNLAREAEDFQAVGNHLRECLLAFAREHAEETPAPTGEERPQLANFVAWSALVVRAISSDSEREYLQKLARITWDLVQPLVHDRRAWRFEAELALDAVNHFLHSVELMEVGHERGEPPKCPECGSYRLIEDFRPHENHMYRICEQCHWEEVDEEADARRETIRKHLENVEGEHVLPPKNQSW